MTVQALPTLDVNRLVKMIEWAEYTENFGATHWWDQSSWGQLRVDDWALEHELVALFEQNKNVFDRRVQDLVRNDGCGSTGCIAGHTVHDAGYRMIFNSDFEAFECILQVPTHDVDEKGGVFWKDAPDAEPESIPVVAATLLGLAEFEAAILFHADNSIERLKGWTNVFARARGLSEPYPDVVIEDREDTENYYDEHMYQASLVRDRFAQIIGGPTA